MEVTKIIAEIDAQIARLQQARTLLAGSEGSSELRRAGRPKGSRNVATSAKKSSRKLSPEGRKRIADAMKRRWAEKKKKV